MRSPFFNLSAGREETMYPVLSVSVVVFKLLSLIFPLICFIVSVYLLLENHAFISFAAGVVVTVLSWFLFRIYAEGIQMFIDIAESARALENFESERQHLLR